MIHWIQAHQLAAGLVAAWLISTLVTSMPNPDDKSSRAYAYWFKVLHSLVGSAPRVFPWLRFGNSSQQEPPK